MAYLRQGFVEPHGVAAGPMQPVVEQSRRGVRVGREGDCRLYRRHPRPCRLPIGRKLGPAATRAVAGRARGPWRSGRDHSRAMAPSSMPALARSATRRRASAFQRTAFTWLPARSSRCRTRATWRTSSSRALSRPAARPLRSCPASPTRLPTPRSRRSWPTCAATFSERAGLERSGGPAFASASVSTGHDRRSSAATGGPMITLNVNGRDHQVDADAHDAAALRPARRSRAQRRQVRLRARASAAPARSCWTTSRSSPASLRCCRRRSAHHDGRRPRHHRQSRSSAARLHRRAGGAVRLLHPRHDHAGAGAAAAQSPPRRRRRSAST